MKKLIFLAVFMTACAGSKDQPTVVTGTYNQGAHSIGTQDVNKCQYTGIPLGGHIMFDCSGCYLTSEDAAPLHDGQVFSAYTGCL